MATFTLTDCEIYLDEYDVTANVTQATPSTSREDLDATTFGSKGHKERKPGIEDSTLELMTFYDGDLIEEAVQPLVGVLNTVVSVTADDVVGSGALFSRGVLLSATRGLPVGQMAKLDCNFASSSTEGLISGRLLAPKATRTATGNGTGVQVGAASSSQTIYAAAHVFSVAGTSTPTLTLKVQSDDNSGFTSATDRITFTNFTAAGVELKSLAGAVTDDYWRVTWTISGTSPQFGFAVVLGIK